MVSFFKFIRNLLIHFSFFDVWDDVWLDKDIINWYKDKQTIDIFLRKYEGHNVIKYRLWEYKTKRMTYISINFPINYTLGAKVF